MPRSALGLRITTTCICSPPFRFLAHPMQAGAGTFRQGQQRSVCDGLHHHQRTAAGGDGDAVRPGSVLVADAQRVASALRKAIISKSIPEGAELTLENTAQELGVSVTPVREAFQILARDGLLEVKQNRCAIVLGVTEKTIREHYQLRAALEGTACMLCCQNNADLSKIKNCVDTAEEALSHQQAGNYTDYNQSFHFEIWEASGNEKMRNLLSELWNGLSIGVEMSELDYALNSQSEHKKIYAALEARDALAARAEMEKHILRSMDDALTYYL